VGRVTIHVETVIALEQHVVRADHVAGVKPDLLPGPLATDETDVHVVVGNHRSCPR
jgi:hypothetical protein